MKTTILALTVLTMTSGMAFAQNAAYPTHADAAPPPVAVDQSTNIDYSSTASIGSTEGSTYQQERARIIQERADNR